MATQILTRTVSGEVRCLNCSRFLGEVAQAGGQLRLVRRGEGDLAPRVAHGRLCCGRCGGSALVEWE